MHEKNLHKDRYNFPELIKSNPSLKEHVIVNRFGDESIDFDNPLSVRVLNASLLLHFYGIKNWIIPQDYLCPPIPSRVDYIHHVADLFKGAKKLSGIDIGCGANCIYPLVGHKIYDWSFVATDIDPVALETAGQIIHDNHLEKHIDLRLQTEAGKVFGGVIKHNESFDFSLCNPPFHSSAEEAMAGTERKRKNLKLVEKQKLNFGGKSTELWCEGGEKEFISKMIFESARRTHLVTWFTTLVSKELNLPPLEQKLQSVGCKNVKIINMFMGQKKSRILAWSWK